MEKKQKQKKSAPTFETVWAMFQETSKQFKETKLFIEKLSIEADKREKERRQEEKERRQEEKERRQEEEERRQEEEKRRQEEEERRQEEEKREEKRRQEAEIRDEKRRQEEEKRRQEAEIREEKRRQEEEIREEKRRQEEEIWRQEEKERRNIIDAQMKNLNRMIGGISYSNGDMAEEFFYNTLKKDKTFLNEKFDSIRKNLTYRGLNNEYEVEPDAEYDILLFNGTSAALIEVKYNAKQNNIDVKKLLRRAEIFKIQFPEYKNHKLYLAVAAMSFKGWIVKKLHRAGIATIRQVGRKMVVYDKEVKAF